MNDGDGSTIPFTPAGTATVEAPADPPEAASGATETRMAIPAPEVAVGTSGLVSLPTPGAAEENGAGPPESDGDELDISQFHPFTPVMVMVRELRDVAYAVETAIDQANDVGKVLLEIEKWCRDPQYAALHKKILELTDEVDSLVAELEPAEEILVGVFETVGAGAQPIAVDEGTPGAAE